MIYIYTILWYLFPRHSFVQGIYAQRKRIKLHCLVLLMYLHSLWGSNASALASSILPQDPLNCNKRCRCKLVWGGYNMKRPLSNSIWHLMPYQNMIVAYATRVCWGRVTPLGRYRSVYKTDVECRFLSQNVQMTLKVKVNDPHFQHRRRESQDVYLVQMWSF